MKYTMADALTILRPDSSWNFNGSEYSGLEWLDSGATKPTESELNTKVAELDAAEPMRLLRIERDKKIAQTDWRVLPDQTPSDDWINYRQALRDLPASASPKLDSNYELDLTSVTWPTEPS